MQSRYKRLTDPQWEIVKKYLFVQRKRRYKLRAIVDAIFWCLRLGNQLRNLPDNHSDWRIVYYYFRKWKQVGTLGNINLALNRLEREKTGKEATPAMFYLDS